LLALGCFARGGRRRCKRKNDWLHFLRLRPKKAGPEREAASVVEEGGAGRGGRHRHRRRRGRKGRPPPSSKKAGPEREAAAVVEEGGAGWELLAS